MGSRSGWRGTLAVNGGLLALYLATGIGGLRLALSAGYASPFFPAAGVLFAFFLSYGRRAIPAMLVGSLLLDAWIHWSHHLPFTPAGALQAGVTALADLLQVSVGAALFRRYLDPGLATGRSVLGFLLLAPTVSVISAAIALGTRWALGLDGGVNFGQILASWWIGDTIGVLLAAPLCWVFIGQPRALWWRRRWILGVPLLLSTTAFIAIYHEAQEWERAQHLQSFQLKAQRAGDLMQADFSEHERFLYAMARALDDDAAAGPTRDAFTRVARSYLERRPGILGISWCQHVPDAARSAFEARMSALLNRAFHIADRMPGGGLAPAPRRPGYCPLLYVEPAPAPAVDLAGWDFLADPVRGGSLRRAARAGSVVATPPLPLLGTGTGGIVLFKPVNQSDPAEAWSAMIGLGVETSRLVGQALRQAALTEGVATSFVDTTGPDPVALQQGIAASYRGADYRRELRFGGRTYELRFAPTAPWLRQNVGWESWTVLACGLLLTALMGGLMLVVSGEQAQIRAQVDESTARLREREARLDAILNHASEAIMPVTLDGTVVACNTAAARMFGYSEEALEGMNFERLVRVGPDGAARALAALAEAGEPSTDYLGCHAQGTSFPLFLSVAKVATPDDVFFVCMMHDLTEQYRSRERIHRLAHHDPLTGLENRFSLNQRLDQLLAQARRSGETVGLLFIDLDHFKKINDSFGHAAGDQFLVTVAARLKELLREGDTIARLGGDEFIVVTSGQLGPENLAVVAERIVQSLSAPYEVAAATVHSGASVGVALYPQDGADAGALLRSADTAMYAAKASGRNNFQFFSAAMNAAAHERLQLESQLWRALDNDEFELWLQPQIDLASGHVIGAEALLRWRHPERGLVPPDRFIPIAEDTGIIVPLGEWVLKRAADIVLRWRAQGLDHLRIAINLSARQCTGAGPLPLLDQILAATGISPSCLELEITESAAMQDPEHTRMLIDGMRARGTHVAIDDFGTGYSSLSYLKLFDIDRIKIDRGFVKDIETDPNDAAIVTATIGLAHALGLRVVAEGVETEAQRCYLRREGCDEAQGYLFARPLPEPEFLAWVQARLIPASPT